MLEVRKALGAQNSVIGSSLEFILNIVFNFYYVGFGKSFNVTENLCQILLLIDTCSA